MGCASIECGCSRRAAAPRGGRQGRGRGGLGWMSELTGGRAQGAKAWKWPQGHKRKPPAGPMATTWPWSLENEQLFSGMRPEGSQSYKMQVEEAEGQRLSRWGVGTADPGFKVG